MLYICKDLNCVRNKKLNFVSYILGCCGTFIGFSCACLATWTENRQIFLYPLQMGMPAVQHWATDSFAVPDILSILAINNVTLAL